MFFIGIDPGKKDLKTTGICILEEKYGRFKAITKTVYGKNATRVPVNYLKDTKVVAIEAPISYGSGKGKMRLWEKYFSQKTFRKKHVNPLPPAFMRGVIENSMSIVEFLKQKKFDIDVDIIETFHPLLIKVIKNNLSPKVRIKFKSTHEYHAFYCSFISYLHSINETFSIGYTDGKVFLPMPKFWHKKDWEWFEKTWHKKHPFKYKYLETDLPELQSKSQLRQ